MRGSDARAHNSSGGKVFRFGYGGERELRHRTEERLLSLKKKRADAILRQAQDFDNSYYSKKKGHEFGEGNRVRGKKK